MWKKNTGFFQSAFCALRGLIYAIRHEHQFKSYFVIIFVTLIIRIVLHLNLFSYLTYFVGIASVFACECLNTAIEMLADKVDSKFDKEVGLLKDVAAGSLLVWGIFFFGSEVFWYLSCI